MKTNAILALALLPLTTTRSGPIDTAIVAAMNLSEQPNYSWTCTVMDDASTYDIKGETERNGYTWQRLPMIKSVARRLGRDADSVLETIFRDAGHFAIRTQDGWKTLDELPRRDPDWMDEDNWWGAPVSVPMAIDPLTGAITPLDPFGWPAVILYPAPPARRTSAVPYSNAQLALALPHEELGVMVSSYEAMHVEDDIATGTLTDLGAQLLLVREGQGKLEPVMAAGGFRLWLKGGRVVKYDLELAGILVVDRKKVLVRQKSHTVLHDIGKTRVDVPIDVQRKFGG
ncbi:MAG: hypothetical protein Q7S40_04155 [Opitutaceae bacterium]|nr:hypothetical protein [Opitutaceae bacterium]